MSNPNQYIAAVLRPVEGTEWLSDTKTFLAEKFPDSTRVNSRSEYSMHFAPEEDFAALTLPSNVDIKKTATDLSEAVPHTFGHPLPNVSVSHIGYFNPTTTRRGRILRTSMFVALESDKLIAESDAIHTNLASYGFSPRTDSPRFAIIFGAIDLSEISRGNRKWLKRSVLDRLPVELELLSGKIEVVKEHN